MNDLFLTKLTL